MSLHLEETVELSAEWNIISAYTHKIVCTTRNIKDFCSEQPDFSKNAHIQIYKTNTLNTKREGELKALLPTYKGFFIRKANDNNPLPYPDKKFKNPVTYDIYKYASPTKLSKIDNVPVKEFPEYAKSKGWSASDRNNLLLTCKPDAEGNAKLASFKNMFLVPRGEYVLQFDTPEYVDLNFDTRGSGKLYAVYDNNLNIVAITRDLVGFVESVNKTYAKNNPKAAPYFKYHKPLYKTNTPHKHDNELPQMEFYKGYCIRLVKDLDAGTAIRLPTPSHLKSSSSSAYNQHLNLVIWDSYDFEEGEDIIAHYTESFERSYGKTPIEDKNMFYKIAQKFSEEPMIVDGLNIIFTHDIIGNKDILEEIKSRGIILPSKLTKQLNTTTFLQSNK